METILKLQLNIFCLIIVAILWLSGDRRRKSEPDVDARLFRSLLFSTAAMLLAESAMLLFDGMPGRAARASAILADVLYYALHALPIPLAILYADFQLYRDEERLRRLARPLVLVVAAVALGSILSPAFDLYFKVDEANRSVRGPWFFAFVASQFALSFFLVGYIARNRRRVSRRVFAILVAYPFPMMVAAALQTAFPGLRFLWPTMTLFLIIVASNIENRRSKTDFLTGTANRRSLDEELERRIESARAGRRLCGLLLDIDGFKGINDRFGHEAGDRALEDVAGALLASVRVEDLVARFGGDEFVILVDSIPEVRVGDLVERIEGAIENLNASRGRPYRLSLSIGRSEYDAAGAASGAEFLAILDADMYRRKKGE